MSATYDDRRRSQRVMMRIPITVSGETEWESFTEETYTLAINANGALIALITEAFPGQKIQLKSPTYLEPVSCRVVWRGTTHENKTQCGIAFLHPVPNFWRVAFPPEDWIPAPEKETVPTQ